MNTTLLLDLLSHTALKGAAVLLVALLLGLGLRKMAAARRYALWITAIATLAVLPLAMRALPAWRVLPPTDAALEWPVMEPPVVIEAAASALAQDETVPALPATKTAPPMPATAIPQPSFSWNMTWQDVVGVLPLVWITIATLLLLRLAWSAWCLQRLERLLQPAHCAALAEITHEIGLSRAPRLFVGDASAVPMVWGVWRPRLLLPQGFEIWSREKQRGVLLHELSHLKRRDPLALWTAQWVKALHWFNPLVWLTLRQLRADQERACDDAVLRHGVRPSDYAQSLLDLSRHTRLAPGLSLCALTITRSAPVESRVKAILDPSRRREGLTLRWLATLAGGALLITLPVAMLHAIEGPTLRGRILDRNGVVLAESTKEKMRSYPLKTLAAHVVGYTRLPDSEDARLHGGAGVEKKEDAALKEGKDVTLTLDARIQALTLQAMKDGGVERGAAVVLDPRTGEILASVSLPGYDPNLFVPSVSFQNWDRYLKDIDIPLMNRAMRGHVPGAVYLPLTALAGIAAGVGDSRFTCEGKVSYGNKAMPCWINRQSEGKHGELDMRSGFVASCNCFWYQFGNAAGIEQIEAMGRKIGFGTRYGILDDESAGIMPSPSWLEQHRPKERWSAGYTANVSIGQGFTLASPLQLAVLAATVGNSGKVPQPSLLRTTDKTTWRADLAGEGLPLAQIETLRDAMRLVVNDAKGTGKSARSERVIIAGRTGTAQNWRFVDGKKMDDNHTWFIGFAPFDQPTLAFAILKNGGKSGGSDCAPIAKRIVEEALALPADGSGEVKPVEEKSVEAQTRSDFRAARKPPQIIKKTTAKVISRSSSTASNSLVIDKGSLDGIVANSPVITAVGLVGKTSAPQPHTTKVILLTDELCLVSAKVEGTLEQGVLAGERTAKAVQPQLHLRFLSRFAKISVGSSVYSSGEGGVFPADLLLGRVKQFKSGDVSGEAIVEPAIDFSTLDEVFVIEMKRELPDQDAATPSAPADPAQLRPQADVEIRMKPALANRWAALKKAGLLADLPAGVSMMDLGTKEVHFSAVREVGHRWLLSSVYRSKNVDEASLLWPAPPEPFHRTYEAAGHCMITIHSSDGTHLHIIVSQQTRSILIAPDESVPPAPKTAAPKALSGVVSNDTQPVDEGGQLKPDFDAEEVSRQIRLLAKKTGISLREFKNGGGKLFFIGLSDDLENARLFGDVLTQSGKQWGIAWKMTTPAKVQDRPVMMFMAVGAYPTASISAAISAPPHASVSAAIGVVSPLSHWRTLQKFGKLADLPADYAPERITPAESLAGPTTSVIYAYTASRKAVHAWLSASLSSKRLEAQADKLRELGETKLFQHDFWGQDLCRVRVVCDEDRARVLISRMTPIFQIAPDESQKPRPAGKLAPEYRQDGLTSTDPALPTLDATLQTLRSMISAHKEKRLPKLVPPLGQLKVRSSAQLIAPKAGVRPLSLERLQGELSADSEKALQHSSGVTGSRARQTLLAKLPLTQ